MKLVLIKNANNENLVINGFKVLKIVPVIVTPNPISHIILDNGEIIEVPYTVAATMAHLNK